ncbi:MAG: GvpL/GvpF family gas vesicle protein [Candidatus Bathyarchaeia archaeon]
MGKDMILNGSYLISKKRVEEFRKSLDETRRRYEDRGFKLLFSEPWAPYNFTEIKYR